MTNEKIIDILRLVLVQSIPASAAAVPWELPSAVGYSQVRERLIVAQFRTCSILAYSRQSPAENEVSEKKTITSPPQGIKTATPAAQALHQAERKVQRTVSRLPTYASSLIHHVLTGVALIVLSWACVRLGVPTQVELLLTMTWLMQQIGGRVRRS